MQIVGYDTGAFAEYESDATGTDDVAGESRDPAILVASEGPEGRTVERIALVPGTELDYGLGDRRCAGSVDGDFHHACPRETAPYCDDHASTWVCARCTGTCLKDEMDCYEDHAIYLAAFAPATFKVGVTREWRLNTRLREQGADRAAHLRTVANGRIAREQEAAIARDPDLPVSDRVRVPRKVEGIAESVDEAAWTDFLAGFDTVATFEFTYDLDLPRRPVADVIASGTVVGVKGRVLVVENGGTTYAVDLRDLVGHEVTEGGSSRDRQSSLGAFG